jgi:hypothetical protein
VNVQTALVAALVLFACACGLFALAGVLLALLKLAADTATAIAAAGIGATVSIPLARCWKRK